MRADGEHMKADGDAFRVLGWGLRRYAWVVAVCVLALGYLVPMMLSRVPDHYDARAQVGPTEPLHLPNLDPLPRLAETVFNNGAVAAEVRQSYSPPLPPSDPVIPQHVELVAAQDNVVFTIVGHGATPEAAERIANHAASKFTEELNKYRQSVGSFAIQRLAATPTRPSAQVDGPLAVGLGILGGVVAGVGVVCLLLVWRRPVVEVGGAEAATGAPVLARVLLASDHKDIRGLPQLCHRVRSGRIDMLLLAGSSRTRRERRLLAAALNKVLRPVRRNLVIIDGPTQADVATRPEASLTLLVVREGTGFASLRRQAEHYLDDGASGVVLVRTARRDPRTWWERPRPAARDAVEPMVPETRRSRPAVKSPVHD